MLKMKNDFIMHRSKVFFPAPECPQILGLFLIMVFRKTVKEIS